MGWGGGRREREFCSEAPRTTQDSFPPGTELRAVPPSVLPVAGILVSLLAEEKPVQTSGVPKSHRVARPCSAQVGPSETGALDHDLRGARETDMSRGVPEES